MNPALEWLLIAFVCAGAVFYLAYRRYARGKLLGDLFFWAVILPSWMFFLVLGLAGKYKNGSDEIVKILNAFFGWAIRAIGLRATQILIALGVSTLGLGAHYFKVKNQKWYGRVEMLVGFLSALFVAGSLAPNKLDLAKWATLAGVAYVIARGRENYEAGRDKVSATRATNASGT